jgi:lipoate-protein ligase A
LVVHVSPERPPASSLTRSRRPILRFAQDDAVDAPKDDPVHAPEDDPVHAPKLLRYTLWLDALPRPGWLNMALDRALLERAAAGESWLRLYAWSPACLSFGRHEPATRRYDREQIAALGLDVVRRPTGGRAVWHAGELTYALAAPAEALGTLRDAYAEIHRVIRDAVRALGAQAELAPARPATRPDAGACFAAPAGGEVMVGDRKVAGSAQLRDRGALLQHGSILLADDQAMVGRVTRGAAPADRSAPLARMLGRPVGWAEAADAVIRAAAGRWGAAEGRADPAAVLARGAAAGALFRSPDWTWDAREVAAGNPGPPTASGSPT